MKLIIDVPDTFPIEQIKKIRDGQWHLDISGFQLIKATSNEEDGTDEIVGQCQNIQFHPVSQPEGEGDTNGTLDRVVKIALPDFEQKFWNGCRKDVDAIREHSLAIQKKLKFDSNIAPVSGVIVGGIAAAAATSPQPRRVAVLNCVRPFLVQVIKQLAIEAQAALVKDVLRAHKT